MTGSFKHGNESLDSVRGMKFLDQLGILLAFQEQLCSMELHVITLATMVPHYITILIFTLVFFIILLYFPHI